MADHDDIRSRHGYHTLRVKRVVQETADTRSFVLDVPGELAESFAYRAGQFCTFRVRMNGDETLRSYSMSSAPETDADLTVTVKRVPTGVVSNWFNDHVDEDDVVEVTKPAGVFCVGDTEEPLVAFCGGSGITPVLSIAKSVLAATDRTVRLLYANRDRDSVIFDDELRALGERYPDRLEVRHHFDSEDGFPESRVITEFAEKAPGAGFYLCGPEPFMDLVENSLHALGIDSGQILLERFAAADDSDRAPEVDSSEDNATPESVTVMLNGKKATASYRPGDTILETARRGGLTPPSSCEAGNCATCMALLHTGSARMRENNALMDDEVEEGYILTCQAVPEGSDEVTVEYESF